MQFFNIGAEQAIAVSSRQVQARTVATVSPALLPPASSASKLQGEDLDLEEVDEASF